MGMLATTGCLTKGTHSSRIFSELAGCISRAKRAIAVVIVCQKILAPEEIPCRFFLTTFR